MELTQKKCQPCEGGVPPLKKDEIENYKNTLKTKWQVEDDRKIRKSFEFKDFKKTMDFVNQVADIAEEEGHHPDIHVHYGMAVTELTTHAIGGLSENDFIVAAKIDELVKQ
jgi:4a-hydroxytetrahydrobiopterin dehydratase